MRYFRAGGGGSLSGSTLTLDPAKGDYLRFGGSLVTIDMVNPWAVGVSVKFILENGFRVGQCGGGQDCETRRWRGGRGRCYLYFDGVR